ncbi:CD99 antigen-like protein 2 [Labeo rohita]|uniref:CD99 antigen-like protein 2 n=1 Tax=Labeo rohita TaxID=84645 RepID=A0ABQ8MEC0_LABRO|nr:CD99 antigen-like protein 2 [Labeo rohita]
MQIFVPVRQVNTCSVADSGSGTVVGVVCGIAVAAVGAITGYFAYLKKKLCFKVQRGDLESAREENGTQGDPQGETFAAYFRF